MSGEKFVGISSIEQSIDVLGKKFYITQYGDTSAFFLALTTILLHGKKALDLYDKYNIRLTDRDDKLWDFLHEKFKE